MKKVHLWIYLLFIITFIIGCNKDDDNLPIEGTLTITTSEWNVEERNKRYQNDSLDYENLYLFTVKFSDNGQGSIIGGGIERPFYWIEDDGFIIIVELFGNNGSSSIKFDITTQEADYQEWINDRTMTDVITNNTMRLVKEWKLELR